MRRFQIFERKLLYNTVKIKLNCHELLEPKVLNCHGKSACKILESVDIDINFQNKIIYFCSAYMRHFAEITLIPTKLPTQLISPSF